MNRRLDRWRHQAGLTLIELLIGLLIVGTLIRQA
ncbi:MAG TPA: prepilin-type N-terminal cleavage/methylation domain-containing protein [Candidatus Methylomirabilis sp.]